MLNFEQQQEKLKKKFLSKIPTRYTAEMDDSLVVTNIEQSVRDYVWNKYGWKALALVLILIALSVYLARVSGSFYLSIIPIVIIYSIYNYIREKMQRAFWRQFAKARGWQYELKGNITDEKALWFDRGHKRRLINVVSGQVDIGPIRIFEHHFSTGSGRREQQHCYTVFEFKYQGDFPHLYLDCLDNGDSCPSGEKISLPAEFEKRFKLFGPRKYEIEALQVFTPDTLSYVLDSKIKADIEIVDHELLIFASGKVETLEKLETEYGRALDLARHLEKKLSRFKFDQIGDFPYLLRR